MGRGIATGCLYLGILMVEGGKVVAALAAAACLPVGIIGAANGNAEWLALIFPGAPAVAGVLNVGISWPGAVLVKLGAALRGESLADYY